MNYITKHILKDLQRSEIFDASLVSGADFSFQIPTELAVVIHIYPKAFAYYLPRFIEQEFKKRTDKKVKVGVIVFEAETEAFLDESVLTYKISGKVKEL